MPTRPLYARVDMVSGSGSELELVELELIEPSLFLGLWPAAAGSMAAGIVRRMVNGGIVEPAPGIG